MLRILESTGTCQAQDWKVSELRESNCSLLSPCCRLCILWYLNCYCLLFFMFLEEMSLEISTFLCHPCTGVRSVCILSSRFWHPRNLGFIHLWCFKTCSIRSLDCLLTRHHFFCFPFSDLTFFFCLTLKLPLVRKGLSSQSTEYYATVSCICCIHGIYPRHRKKYLLFQKSFSKLNSQLVSFALCSCYTPKSLRDLVS